MAENERDVPDVRAGRTGGERVAERVKERPRVVVEEGAHGIEPESLGARERRAIHESAGGVRLVVDAISPRAEHRDAGSRGDLAGRRERDLAVSRPPWP